MTHERTPSGDRGVLAAELALGVLTGHEHSEAIRLTRTDAGFRADVARWWGWLGELLDEVEPATPRETVWRGIERRIVEPPSDNVISLRRRLSLWRATAAGTSALAASLAAVLLLTPRPAPVPVAPAAATPMAAALADDRQALKLLATWDPRSRQLVLAVGKGLSGDPGHSHQLWVIPSDGTPRSLGVMGGARATRMQIADALVQRMANGATIAVSVEPRGGSPTGAPTGPVVASGKLDSV